MLFTFTDPDVFIDISDTIDLKVKSLEAHVSQVGDFPAGEFIRERNKEIAKVAKEKGVGDFELAECFKLFRLEEF
jgi:LmbE family N-acetylglucosaminyl deacetylase